MKLHEILQFAAATIPIVAVLWQIAEMKYSIYKYIDVANNSQSYRISELEKSLAVHQHLYEERKEFVDYQLHALNELVKHKFDRVMKEIQDLESKS